MATKKDISVDQGSKYIEDFLLKDSDDNAIDLVGSQYAARMKVKRDYNSNASTILELTTENGRLVLHRAGVTGRLSIVLTEADTNNITIKGRVMDAVYDLELLQPAGSPVVGSPVPSRIPKRLIEGEFKLTKQITT